MERRRRRAVRAVVQDASADAAVAAGASLAERSGGLKDPWQDEEPPSSVDASADETSDPAESGRAQPAGGPEPLVRERRDPKRARSLAHQGMAAYEAGNYAQATLSFERALAQNPSDKIALIGMRDTYFDKGDYGRSSRYGRRVVRLAPRSAAHRLRLGDAYFKVGRNRQAEKEYQKALEYGDERARSRLKLVRRRLGE